MKYRVLLSDADGTLFDFHKGEKVAIEGTFERFGIPVTAENIAAYSRANDAEWKKLERGETTQAKLRVDRFVEFLRLANLEGDAQALSEDYVERLGQQRWPLPFSVELCREVSRHMPIYLVTNGIARIQRSRFTDCDIAPYISGLVISEEVGKAKPDPAMIFEALRLAGVEKEQAVLLGDSVTADIGAANNAGVDSILFTGGKPAPENHGATWAVQTLEDALRLILQ